MSENTRRKAAEETIAVMGFTFSQRRSVFVRFPVMIDGERFVPVGIVTGLDKGKCQRLFIAIIERYTDSSGRADE